MSGFCFAFDEESPKRDIKEAEEEREEQHEEEEVMISMAT